MPFAPSLPTPAAPTSSSRPSPLLPRGSRPSPWSAKAAQSTSSAARQKAPSVTLDTNRLHYGDITLKASFHHTPAACAAAFALISGGKFKAADFITRTAPLDEVPAVFSRMMTRSADNITDIKTAVLPNGYRAQRQREPRMTGQAELAPRETKPAIPLADSLVGAPPQYLTPEVRPTLEEARAWCHELATSHYENFHVATFFLPKARSPPLRERLRLLPRLRRPRRRSRRHHHGSETACKPGM